MAECCANGIEAARPPHQRKVLPDKKEHCGDIVECAFLHNKRSKSVLGQQAWRPNVPYQRPHATDPRHGTEAASRGSLQTVCQAANVSFVISYPSHEAASPPTIHSPR